MTDLSVPPVAAALVAEARRLLLAPAGLDDAASVARARVDPHARRRFRRPLFPVLAVRELEPRGRHRQVGRVQHRPRRRRARRARRQAGVRVLRRHHARGARRGGAARRARSAARGSRRRRRSVARRRARMRCTRRTIRSHRCPTKRKVALLERLEQMARARDPRVAQVMASLAGEYEAVLVARSDGLLAADVRPLVRVSLTVIVEENGRREQGYAGGGGRFDYALFHRRDARRLRARRRSTRRCSTSARATRRPAR